MRFALVDRVVDFQPGVAITAVKCLTLGEEYLADHFPRFPVMPGVLMLESMTEVGAWLIRASEDFVHTIVTLKEAKNIRFADFVRPGHTLTIRAEFMERRGEDVQLKTQGTVDGRTAVSGRLVLSCANAPASAGPDTDAALRQILKRHWTLIYQPIENRG